jgi:hypothetical protein
MAQFCTRCRQSYADQLPGCPRCQPQAAVNGKLTGQALDATPLPSALRTSAPSVSTEAPSDAQIDLGKPVTGSNASDDGPPSGASFVSWSALAKGGPARQGARLLQAQDASTPKGGSGDDDAQVDLGGPVGGPRDKDDPPSGASFVSWSALLRNRRDLEDEKAPAKSPPTASSARSMLEGPRIPAPPAPRRPGWIGAVLFGIALALALCLALWLFGY